MYNKGIKNGEKLRENIKNPFFHMGITMMIKVLQLKRGRSKS
jgi:hypothetical protein